MEKKLIFFDIDGTLIDGRHGVPEPSAKTTEIIQKMIEKGHIPVVATGRPLCMIGDTIKNVGFQSYISSAGAHVMLNGEVIHSEPISAEIVQAFFDDALALGLYVFTEDSEYVYVHPTQYDHWVAFFTRPGTNFGKNKIVAEANYLDKANYKLFVRFENGTQDAAYEKLYNKYKDDFNFGVFTMPDGHSGTDVIYKTHSKAVGIQKMLDHLGLSKESTYGVGDGANDLEMIEMVAHGIAMGNGVPALKEKATYITDSVVDEGIYNFFSKQEWMK